LHERRVARDDKINVFHLVFRWVWVWVGVAGLGAVGTHALDPHERALVGVAVLDATQPLLAGVGALGPGVDGAVAAAVPAYFSDNDAPAVAPYARVALA